MKLTSILSAGLFAAVTTLSFGAYAAADADKPAEVKAPATADAKADKVVAKKKVKKHSHVEEKTGTPQSEPEATSDKVDIAKDKSKHFHPRDGK